MTKHNGLVKNIWRWLGYILMLIALFFAFKRISANGTNFISLFHRFSVEMIAGIVVLTILSFMLLASGWGIALYLTGSTPALQDIFTIYFQANILRYIPGSIWNFPGRAALCQAKGIPLESYLASLFWELFSLFTSAILLGALGITAAFQTLLPLISIPVLLGLFGVFFIIPERYLPRLLKRRNDLRGEGNWGKLGLLFSLHLLSWSIYGFVFAIVLNSLKPLGAEQFLSAIPVNVTAWFIGFLSPSPAGFGVRELAVSNLLGEEFSALSITAELVQRSVEMIIELILWAIAIIRKR